MKFSTVIFCCLFVCSNLWSQSSTLETQRVGEAIQPKVGKPLLAKVTHPSEELRPWNPRLLNTSFSHDTEDDAMIARVKAQKTKLRAESQLRAIGESSSAGLVDPTLQTNFAGNAHNGFTPPDNDVAISNGGQILSVTNSAIYVYNSSGTLRYSNSFATHFSSLGLSSTYFDPVVIYDAMEDRFVLCVLNGSTSTTSRVVVSFSQTNDPAGSWNTYAFTTASDIKSNRWFDYPKIGVNDHEVFVSGNLFQNSGGGFDEAVVLQMDKDDGFSGASLSYLLYDAVGSYFTITPMSQGHGSSYGRSEMFFVSNSSGGNNRVFLHNISNKIGSSPTFNSFTKIVSSYAPAANADQQGTSNDLSAGDCRVQSGFYLNDWVHYVFTTDVGSGWNGIYYGRLNVNTLASETTTFGNAGTADYCYPKIASFSTSSSDRSAAITFQASSNSMFPQLRVVAVDDFRDWSGSILVRGGTGFVNILSGSVERWGDYIGISRKHNSSSPTVWVAGAVGNSSNTYSTWIGEIGAIVSGIEDVQPINDFKIFPNPIIDNFNVEFDLDKRTMLKIDLLDIQGRVVKHLYFGKGKPGKSQFTFNKAALSAGTYFLRIADHENIYKNAQITITH